MQQFILHIIEQFGYFGVFFLILIENVFPPIPSEVILLISGFFSSYTSLSVFYMILASTLGSFLGAIILYYIGKIFNKERLKKIVNGRLGKILFLKENDIDKADEWFDNKGNKSVFFCRFVPIVRSLISIPAGMSEMPMGKFIIYTICGSMIWNTVLICLGYRLGSNWGYVLTILDKYQMVVIVILVIIFGYVIIKFYRKKRKSKKI
ncbi:MAG: DedA family protein [Firmicutes bacterium]|nr:DedA family protein [Bacillota bacterium]